MLFQGGALFDSLKVWENVAFRLVNAERMRRTEARARLSSSRWRWCGWASRWPTFTRRAFGRDAEGVGLARAIVGRGVAVLRRADHRPLDPITSAAINELIRERR